jgi:serine protease inhibitor
MSLLQGDENFVLKAANLLYVAENYKIKEEFQTNLEKHFGASGERVNFGDDETRKTINGFVEKFTNNKITNLFTKSNLISDVIFNVS